MENYGFSGLDIKNIETPVYIISLKKLNENCKILADVKSAAECKILLALKAYAVYPTFDIISKYLDGISASGLYEAKLGAEEFKKEVHTFSPAYKEDEFDEIVKLSNKIIFNSFNQLKKFSQDVKKAGKSIGLRINPGYSDIKVDLYNPCAAFSRLGVVWEIFKDNYKKGMFDGLHFHALCEQNSDSLERVLNSFESLYGRYIPNFQWVNFGGGHHITRKDYNIELLVDIIRRFRNKYAVEVILEPGEAIALNAGILVASVVDIVYNKMNIAILDTSAEAHMPDVLAMPYKPHVIGSAEPGEKKYTYRFAGNTCLAGDVIGDYSFDTELKIGDKLIFTDMAIYSIVKNTMFNGVKLPDIALYNEENKEYKVIKKFDYYNYKTRNG